MMQLCDNGVLKIKSVKNEVMELLSFLHFRGWASYALKKRASECEMELKNSFAIYFDKTRYTTTI